MSVSWNRPNHQTVSKHKKENNIKDYSYDEWSHIVNTKLSKIDEPTFSTYREISKEFNLSFSEIWDFSGMKDYFDFVEGDD